MKDGSISGCRIYKKPLEEPSPSQQKRLKKRYGKSASWSRLKAAKTFRDVALAFFETARMVMKRDGFHRNITFLIKDAVPIEIAQTDHPTRASRYVLMRDLARLARIVNADGVMMIGEAWTAAPEDVPPTGYAAEAKRRGEAVVLNAANAAGDSFVLNSTVTRRRTDSLKVKTVSPTNLEDNGFLFMFMPFFVEWGCVDEAALEMALKQQDEMLEAAVRRNN
jgi:hypothetical protein